MLFICKAPCAVVLTRLCLILLSLQRAVSRDAVNTWHRQVREAFQQWETAIMKVCAVTAVCERVCVISGSIYTRGREREVTQQFTKEKFTAELYIILPLIFISVHPFRTFLYLPSFKYIWAKLRIWDCWQLLRNKERATTYWRCFMWELFSFPWTKPTNRITLQEKMCLCKAQSQCPTQDQPSHI